MTITKKSDITPFNLGLKDMKMGLSNIAFTHPGITGIGPNVLYGETLESFIFFKDLLLNKADIPITANREGYVICFFRDIVNRAEIDKKRKEDILNWTLENCKMKDKVRKILLLIYAEYLEISNDQKCFDLYQKARKIRKEDPNPEGCLLLQIKTKKKGFPFNLNADYILENYQFVLSEWGIEHFDEICYELPHVKKDIGKRETLFNELVWKEFFRDFQWSWSAENRLQLFQRISFQPRYSIFHNVIREAENRIRIKSGLPKIGQEKWKQEARLLELIKDYFPEFIVRHHYRSKWLGRQHIDVFIDDINVGIEYHGLQHFEPVDFFGGEDSFNESQRRDEEKKTKCRKQGVLLYIVREGYDIKKLVEQIKHDNELQTV